MNVAPPDANVVLRKQLRYAAAIGFVLFMAPFTPAGTPGIVYTLQHVSDRPGLFAGWLFRLLFSGAEGAALACLVVWLRWKWVHRAKRGARTDQ